MLGLDGLCSASGYRATSSAIMLGKEALQNYGTWQSTQLPSSWRLLKNSEIEKMDSRVVSEVHPEVKFTVALAMAAEAAIVVNLLVAIVGRA